MDAIRDLDRLLAEMDPVLSEEAYVFLSVGHDEAAEWTARLAPLATFREAEGTTLIVESKSAHAHGFDAAPAMRMITLTVHSSLEAVGLTAAVATCLAQAGISANVVAAYHHDHVFGPEADAEAALKALRQLQQRYRDGRA